MFLFSINVLNNIYHGRKVNQDNQIGQKKMRLFYGKFSKLERVIFLTGSLFLVLYIGSLLHSSFLDNCENEIKSTIKKEKSNYYNSVIYLINSVNTYCRPCCEFERLKQNADNRIIFLVEQSFSNADIKNFRKSFNIEEKYIVKRMNKAWAKVNLRCNKSKSNYSNFLILINNGKIAEIRRF